MKLIKISQSSSYVCVLCVDAGVPAQTALPATHCPCDVASRGRGVPLRALARSLRSNYRAFRPALCWCWPHRCQTKQGSCLRTWVAGAARVSLSRHVKSILYSCRERGVDLRGRNLLIKRWRHFLQPRELPRLPYQGEDHSLFAVLPAICFLTQKNKKIQAYCKRTGPGSSRCRTA